MVTAKFKLLHIPKTGGTAIKNYVADNPNCPISVTHTHELSIRDVNGRLIVVIRDPIDRFCSGFWSRKNYSLRQELSKEEENKNYFLQGGREHTDFEKHLFDLAPTPNDMLTLFRTDPSKFEQLEKQRDPLEVLFRSLTYWLGGPAKYRILQSKVFMAIPIESLTNVMLSKFSINLTDQDAFKKRSKDQFGFDQSYAVSLENREWFVNTFRPADYELINYIKQQPYFITK